MINKPKIKTKNSIDKLFKLIKHYKRFFKQ